MKTKVPYSFLTAILILLFSCSRDEGPKVPQSVRLVFPENNSECITGIPVSDNSSEVEFRWQPADNAANYELAVRRIGLSIVERLVTANTSARLVLDRGAPYTWSVTARNDSGTEGDPSPTWQFYNAGSSSSYPPFPASIAAPLPGTSLLPDALGQVELQWSGADADLDLEAYEVYFGTDAAGLDRIGTTVSGQESFTVDVSSGTVYFWEILSRDREGNSSRSGVYSFRVL